MALNTLFSDIIWNLDTISFIENHQTLLVNGDKLCFDDRFLQSLMRIVTDDGRQQILAAIEKTYLMTHELLNSYQHSTYLQPYQGTLYQEKVDIADNINHHLSEIESKRDQVIKGLQILSTFERYTMDSSFQIKIKKFISQTINISRKCVTLQKRYSDLCKENTNKPLNYPIDTYTLNSMHMSPMRICGNRTNSLNSYTTLSSSPLILSEMKKGNQEDQQQQYVSAEQDIDQSKANVGNDERDILVKRGGGRIHRG